MRKPSNCNGTVDFLDAHTLYLVEKLKIFLTPLLKFNIYIKGQYKNIDTLIIHALLKVDENIR